MSRLDLHSVFRAFPGDAVFVLVFEEVPPAYRGKARNLWADNPIKDILLRMDGSDLRIETAGTMEPNSAGAFASRRN
jgi:hypothetical protein